MTEGSSTLETWKLWVKGVLEIIGLLASVAFLGKVFFTSTEAMNALREAGVPFPFDILIVITAFVFPLFATTKLYRQGSKVKNEVKEFAKSG